MGEAGLSAEAAGAGRWAGVRERGAERGCRPSRVSGGVRSAGVRRQAG